MYFNKWIFSHIYNLSRIDQLPVSIIITWKPERSQMTWLGHALTVQCKHLIILCQNGNYHNHELVDMFLNMFFSYNNYNNNDNNDFINMSVKMLSLEIQENKTTEWHQIKPSFFLSTIFYQLLFKPLLLVNCGLIQ